MKQTTIVTLIALVAIFLIGCTTPEPPEPEALDPEQEEIEQQALDEDNRIVEEVPEEVEQIDPPSLQIESTPADDTIEEVIVEAAEKPEATKLANNYYRFNKAHYEQSLSEGKIIFLDFHADWCPVCVREQPNIFAAFNELDDPDVVGYQVHYKDSNAGKDDEEAAKKYGITYQHTKVVVDKNGKVSTKSLESFSKQDVHDAIKAAG